MLKNTLQLALIVKLIVLSIENNALRQIEFHDLISLDLHQNHKVAKLECTNKHRCCAAHGKKG